jgi:hypothetical protein
MDLAMSGSTAKDGADLAMQTAATLDTLMMTSLDTQAGATQAGGGGKNRGRAFGNAWRGAAAYHFLMLAQRQVRNNSTYLN